MSETSLGKKFEQRFKLDWQRCFPGELVHRLPDSMSGFSIANPCDFFGFANGKLFMIECKEHKGQSINWSYISQRDTLIDYYRKGYKNTYQGAVIWFSEHDKVIYVPAAEMEKMVADGEKSIGLRMLEKDYKKSYNIIEIPSEKLRTFLATDYRYLYKQIVGEDYE